jgi:crotonobetainyl-CoA:carnitine CoA-transferase CaiB-like acyl-CoA transferase
MTAPDPVLSTLRVLEVAGSPAVAIAGGVLADLGASVVTVEPPEGSDLRTRPAFHVWARGKHSVASPDRLAEARRLLPGADVVLVDDGVDLGDHRPAHGVVVEIGASHDLAGPRFDGSTAASVGDAESGLDWTQRGHRDGPFYVVEEPSALGTGLLAVVGALAALLGDQHGTRLRVSHTAGASALQLFSAVASPDAGHDAVPPDDGDAQRVTTPLVRFYECADGWITIGVVTPARWANLCVALDMPELISDPRFEAAPFAIPEAADRIWLVEEITRRMRARPVAEWLEHLRAFDVIASPVLEPDGFLDDDQVRAIDMRWEVADPTHGPIVEPGCPITIAGVAPRAPRHAPAVGEHDAAVVAELAAGRAAAPPAPSRSTPAPSRSTTAPLAGLRVLDLSTFGAGPGASRLLAGLGADVVKLEPPEGDPFRLLGYSFVGVNAGKRTCHVDVSDPTTRPLVERFLAHADVVVHNYRRDVAEKLSMTAADIAAVNRGAVQCAVSGYGARGALAGAPAIDVVFESLTGGPLVQGGGTEPVGYTGGFADNGTSLTGVVAVLAALHAKRVGTVGDEPVCAEVSLLATTLYRHADLFVRPLSDWTTSVIGADPVGPHAAHRIYEVADAWVLLAVGDAAGWRALRSTIPELPDGLAPHDPAWNAAVAERIGAAWRDRDADDLLAELRASGVPVTHVERFGDFVRRLRAAGAPLAQDLEDPRWGRLLGLHELIAFERATWRPLDGPQDFTIAELARQLDAP